MQSSTLKPITEFWANRKNPLYKNSLYIALGKFSDVGFGFLFWTFAARLYSVGEVGIATALISSLGLVIAFSRYGFDSAIIRFMPNYDHSRVFNTCLWITTAAAVLVGIIYLALIDSISPDIAFIKNIAFLFISFAIGNAITLTTGNAFLAFRKADLKLIQNLIMGIRIPLLLPLVIFGSVGIFASYGFAYIAGAIVAILMIRKFVSLSPQIDPEFTRETFQFSSLNYLASLFQITPPLVMPILIVNMLGPENAALYSVAFSIGHLALIIPDAMSTSFFVEGSHGINLREGVIRTLTAIYVVLIPAILFIVFFGGNLLSFFGSDYVAALDLLRVIAISGLFVTIYNLFIPLQNIRLQVRGIVAINIVRFVLLIGLSYIFLIWFGITGAGYAWLITYIILTVIIAIILKDKRHVQATNE